MAAEIEFGLLGPLVVRRAGALVAVPAGRQRALLAGLLLNAGQVVPAGELIEMLWGANPPASARVSLRNYVKRLRNVLGDAGHHRIRTVTSGYMISIQPGALDVDRFQARAETAREAARARSWEAAADQLRDALSLWRGAPLADVGSDTLALREGPRLSELWLQAVEAHIDADLNLGRHAEVIAELRQLAEAHPLRERLHALLMLAQYRDGQQAGALATYQVARKVLVGDLGAEAGRELRELHEQILAGVPVLASPRAREVTRAAGPDGPGRSARMVIPRQLPAVTRHSVGRRDELNALDGLLAETIDTGGTVVITAIGGAAGVGKTALAIHWAHRVAGRFPDGQLYVNLRGFDPTGHPVQVAEVIRGFLDAFAVPRERIPASLEAQSGLYRSLVAGRMLVILDNARDASQVRPLLGGAQGAWSWS